MKRVYYSSSNGAITYVESNIDNISASDTNYPYLDVLTDLDTKYLSFEYDPLVGRWVPKVNIEFGDIPITDPSANT